MINQKKINVKDSFCVLLLFVISILYYAFYFNKIIIHPNNVLSTIGGDGFHSYYVYMHHIINDKGFIETQGLNYPFGEHLVYTDCIPLLTFILKALPFSHNYAIGILHTLIFLSYIVNPCIYYKLFRLFNVNQLAALIPSFAIPLLSPQTDRLGGHLALSIACLIPLQLYFSGSIIIKEQKKYYYFSVILSTLSFFIHPYLGLGLTMFSFIITLVFSVLNGFSVVKKNAFHLFITGAIPLIIFKVFLFLTDHHLNRTAEPYGTEESTAKISSVFAPTFGPFIHVIKPFIKTIDVSWEGVSYVGFSVNLLICAVAVILLVRLKKIKINKALTAMFISSVFLLLFSFGVQNIFLKALHINVGFLKQFRALGRFAWFFFYTFSFVLIIVMHNFLLLNKFKFGKHIFYAIVGLTLGLNLLEANVFLRNCLRNSFNSPNVFHSHNLSTEEKALISKINEIHPQAIMPFPYYNIGSEVFSRRGLEESGYISMLTSFHCNLPLLANFNARTSVSEAADGITLLNQYKRQDSVLKLFNNRPFIILKCNDNLRPDEERLITRSKLNSSIGSYKIYTFNKQDFKDADINSDSNSYYINKNRLKGIDSMGIIFLKTDTVSTSPKISDYKIILKLDSNTFKSGDYILSFYYHFKKLKREFIDCNFIEESISNTKPLNWDHMSNISYYAYYDSLFIFENKFNLNTKFNYHFFLHNTSDSVYKISNILLRPSSIKTVYRDNNLLLINNYPVN